MKSGITPTDEQRRILAATGRVIKINARAGTGKTTTLRLIAESHPDEKILYLVFNRKNREEAERTFPRNVKIRSVHAFALASLSALGKRFDIDRNFSVCQFLSDFDGERDRQILATLAYNFIKFFLNSRFEKLEEAVDPYCQEHLNSDQGRMFSRHADRIIEMTRRLSISWNTGEKPCPDDFYLKLSHLRKTFQGALEKFDRILVDEGQDLSQVMMDALAHCTKRIVLVGDTHQGIYGFRYAVDAMRLLDGDEELELSLSFRFGEKIAALATHFIAESTDETGFRIRGNTTRKSVIAFYSDLAFLKKGVRTAILSRTNMGLFKNAMHLRARGRSFRFERDIKAELMRTLDVYRLHCGEKEKIRDELIRSFDSLGQLDKYAERMQDFQLANVSQIVKQYAAEFPKAIFEMIKRTGENGGQDDKEAVILSTVHTAKGQEYERVIIDADIAEAIGRTAEKDAKLFNDEVNVAYVCLTRAKEQLLLPMAMKTALTPAWQSYMEGLTPKAGARELAGKRDGRQVGARPKTPPLRKRKAAPVQSTHSVRDRDRTPPAPRRSARQAAAPVEVAYRIGDRVKTSNGYGTIVAIVGVQHQIALEGQRAKVWENATTLKSCNR